MLKFIQVTINTWFNYLYFSWVKHLANLKAKTENRQKHIVPINGKLEIIDTLERKAYNKIAKKRGLKPISYLDIIEKSYYSTKNKN